MNSIAARMNFTNAVKAISKAMRNEPGFDIRKFKLTQSFLRLEQPLVTGTTNYLFPILINQANPQIFNTEQRLNLQDTFVPAEMGVFIAPASGATDATFKLLTYPSPFVLTNDVAMTAIYNGQMQIMVNNNNLVPNWDLWRHFYVPQTQQTAALGAGSPTDQADLSTNGFYPMEPNVAMIGSKNIRITITLPVGLTAVDANSRLVIFMRGILAQNSTSVS